MADTRKKKKKLGDKAFLETVRRIALYTTDALWMEHLEAMDYLLVGKLACLWSARADSGIQKMANDV